MWRWAVKYGKVERSTGEDQCGIESAIFTIHSNAAGIDIGSASHFMAVPPDCDDEPLREFHSFTVELHRLADWLNACNVYTLAMESAGVYWIPQWGVLRKDRLPSYVISLEQYEYNRHQLQMNNVQGMGAIRHGPSLLSGSLICGRCGLHLAPHLAAKLCDVE